MPDAPYLLGLRTLDREVRIASLPVQGTIPGWLRGTLVRNGPARFEVGRRSYNHWFDGLAMLHAFALRDGNVAYTNRFLGSKSYREAMESGRIRRSEFATDPCTSLFGRVMATFRPPVTDNANIHVVRLAGGLAALTETPLPIRFDAETLETLGVVEFQDDLEGVLTTAHPQADPVTGALYNYLTAFGLTSTYHLYRLDPGSRTRELLASLEVDRPAYMHSFAMTERHLVLAEFPLVVNPVELLLSGKPFIRNYRWEPRRGTRFQLFDRATGRYLGCCTGPPLFAFHHINAFVEEVEGREEVVVDLAGYDDPGIIDALFLEQLREGTGELVTARPWRFRLDPDRGTATRQVLASGTVELPRINESRTGLPYRYVWGVGNRVPGHFTDELVKLDLHTGESLTWYVEGCFPGEPVFVERPPEGGEGGEDAGVAGTQAVEGREDEGILLSVVLDARNGTSFLLVLDAATLRELARAEAPHAMPMGFHGIFDSEGVPGVRGGAPHPAPQG